MSTGTYIEDLQGNPYTLNQFHLSAQPQVEELDNAACRYCDRNLDDCRSEMCEEAAENWHLEYGEENQ